MKPEDVDVLRSIHRSTLRLQLLADRLRAKVRPGHVNYIAKKNAAAAIEFEIMTVRNKLKILGWASS